MEKAVERPSDKEIEEFFLPDCADEAMANSPSMPDRCIGCPGRVGTEANLNAITMTTLDACKRRRSCAAFSLRQMRVEGCQLPHSS